MPIRRLPVRPDLTQLKHQAKDLLRSLRAGEVEALALFGEFGAGIAPRAARLADAQHALAKSYGAPGWPRLVECCNLVDAIWEDDPAAVRRLVRRNPRLLHEPAGIGNRNWGPPLSYAANLGRDDIIRLLRDLGADDLAFALDRAVLQSRVGTAALLHEMMGRPAPPDDTFGGAAYTLSVPGTEFLFRVGARVRFDGGRQSAPVETAIGSDSRNPEAKRRILALYAEHGFEYPDTPVMAFHRGRLDLLQAHLDRDPGLLARRFAIEEIFPAEVGCRAVPYECMGTPVDGGTLLHLAVYWDEIDMAEWLIARGADVNAGTALQPDGFGGHTPLFNAVVSQAGFWMNYGHPSTRRAEDAAFADLLLAHGAAPAAQAAIRMRLGTGHGDPRVREFRDVTPLSWARRFAEDVVPGGKHSEALFVNHAAVRAVSQALEAATTSASGGESCD